MQSTMRASSPHTRTARSILLPPASKTQNLRGKGKERLSVPESSPPRTCHSHEEVWKWTLTKDAIAPCRVEDIFRLQECDHAKGPDPDFFWLGHVPCRSVLFYGMVIAVQVYEQRVVYTLDDGSGKIDCNLRAPPLQAAVPNQASNPRVASTSNKPLPNKGTPLSLMTIPAAPKPIAKVGDIVRAVGRVLNRHNSKLINLDSLQLVKTANEEPLHWLSVMRQHETYYHAPHTKPFVIPPPSATGVAEVCNSSEEISSSAQAMPPPPVPVSPSKSSVSSAPSTPSSVASSSAASQHGSRSPPRLRHPSRLHTRDLTANTFRIYMKHYMDNAPPDPGQRMQRSTSSASDVSEDDAWTGYVPGTPTKSRGNTRLEDMTPRPSKWLGSDVTPRMKSHRPDESVWDEDPKVLRGYTLSHLRRVPELALLARRVVEAEIKRRAKDERHRRKETEAKSDTQGRSRSTTTRRGSPTATMKSTSAAVGKSGKSEPISAKMKRLFRYAIRQLYDEGVIVLWDGPIRSLPRVYVPIPQPSFTDDASKTSARESSWMNRLWKTAGDSTVMSSVSGTSDSQLSLDEEWDELSDPSPSEEAYIPLTSAYLAKIIEDTIVDIMSRPTSTMTRNSRGPPPGPTTAEIVGYLHRRDERWARIGEWAVKEALDWGREQGRLWCIGDDRWEVCG